MVGESINSFFSIMSQGLCSTCVQATQYIVDSDESSAVKVALTITLSSHSTMALGSPLPF